MFLLLIFMCYMCCVNIQFAQENMQVLIHKHTLKYCICEFVFQCQTNTLQYFSQKLFALECGSRNLACWQIIRNDVLGLGEYKSLSVPSILTPALPRATLASGLDQWCCWCTVSVWTWCPHLMELMWMDFTLYLCHLSCINSHPCLSISQSLQLRQRVCVCLRQKVGIECRLAPGCLLKSTPPTRLM